MSQEPPPAASPSQQRPANPEAAKLPDYPLFDPLRFILASVVVLGHAGLPLPLPFTGSLAVDVFFALSGWLIGGILLKTTGPEMPRFFFNRATRIWAPYAAAVVLIYGLAIVKEGIDQNWFKYLFYDVTFTHNLFTVFPRAEFEMPMDGTGNAFWSISVEEQFYLVAPLVMLATPWGKRLWTWVAIAALLLAVKALHAPIALGVIAAILQRDHGDWHLRPVARAAIAAATLATLAWMWLAPADLANALFSVSLILLVAVRGERRPLPVFLGGISYPVYLNHWAGMFFANAVSKYLLVLPGALLGLTGYAAGVAVGAVAYLAIDRNVLRYRHLWYTPRLGRILGAIAYALLVVGLAGGFAIRAAGG